MMKIFKTKSYLKHKYLVWIDEMEQFQGYSDTDANEVVELSDLMIGVSRQVAQEVHDELYILKLFEFKERNGKRIIVLTKAGQLRLYHSHFLKEHWRLIERKLKDYGVILTTLVLALAALVQATQDRSTENLKELQSIKHSLKEIDTTLQKSKALIIHDTIYIQID